MRKDLDPTALADAIARAKPFRIGLRERFRGQRAREGALLAGPAGWAEFSPFPEYPAEVTARWLAAAASFATEPPPPRRRDRVPVNAAIPSVDPDTAARMAAESGCETCKVKVAERGAFSPAARDRADLERVEAVRAALGPAGKIRVDANGGWEEGEAAPMIRALDRFDLEYVEQPVATLEEMAALRRRVDVPLAADESVRTAADPLRVRGLEAADIVVLKVQPLGGVWRALEVAERAGLPAVVSSAVETSIGLAAGVALAAALPELPYACGLGTGLLLADDVTSAPLVPESGSLPARRPEPSDAALARARPDPDAARAIRDRLAAAAERMPS